MEENKQTNCDLTGANAEASLNVSFSVSSCEVMLPEVQHECGRNTSETGQMLAKSKRGHTLTSLS